MFMQQLRLKIKSLYLCQLQHIQLILRFISFSLHPSNDEAHTKPTDHNTRASHNDENVRNRITNVATKIHFFNVVSKLKSNISPEECTTYDLLNEEVKRALEQISLDIINHLIDSMPKRLEEVIKQKGDATKH
ncbi:Hypothetical_protein [Hexamita inflata]|uniref:Hypothetical_protein n=1 Tax=Hexamita inflata TaxID=28002 RepID=A0AA86QZP9_9EUKA|nr:Hypothetical protein HINF_LOCUS56676 [Hexamita inflata]